MTPIPTDPNVKAAIWLSGLNLAAIIVKWARDEFIKWRVRCDLEDNRVAISNKVETAKTEVTQQTKKATETIAAKVDENTAISEKAFSEANNFNAKLTKQGEQLTKIAARQEVLGKCVAELQAAERARRNKKKIQKVKQ